MHHPFLNVDELKELSLEDLQGKISELTRKLNTAYSTNGNQVVINQLYMALESYNTALTEKFRSMSKGSDNDSHSDKIDIS